MYKVRDNRTGEMRTVYFVNGQFFLFFEDGRWYWDDMGFYTPVEGAE